MQACWYSSVNRGSNVRRKFTLPVWPPVAMTTPRRASMFIAPPRRIVAYFRRSVGFCVKRHARPQALHLRGSAAG
jgi:hypothetical protein